MVQLHDLSVVANYRFNRHWSLGGDFVYASGTPYTKAKSVYVINNNIVSEYGKYNGANLPSTHRMDIALTYRFSPRGHREQSLNLSIYNFMPGAMYCSVTWAFRKRTSATNMCIPFAACCLPSVIL